MPASGLILPHHGKSPKFASGVFIAPTATVIGDVELGESSSVWFGAVLRGDVNFIRIGARSNIQDLSMVHVSHKKAPTIIGDDVTVGHRVVLHACTVGNRVLVGMGAILMDNVVVEDDCIIGAGSLLTEGTHIPAGSLVLGSPGKVKRPLTDEEKAFFTRSSAHYVSLAKSYQGGPWPVETGLR